MTNPLDNAFGLPATPTPKFDQAISTIVATAKNDSASEDFEFARANIRETMENATDAIAKLASIADQSQEPRAFEVLAKLMDTVVNASKELLANQEKIRKLDKADVPRDEEAKKSVTNNLFVGSTKDLNDVINKLREG